MTHTITWYDLRDAFHQPGCPVCRLTLAAVDHYIESMDYDSVNDPDFRASTLAAHGFCNIHAYQWLRQAHVLGTAMIYRQLCAEIRTELERLSFHERGWLDTLASRFEQPPGSDADCDFLVPKGECPVCQAGERRERMAISTLLEALAEPEIRDLYRDASAGLCLPHLHLALCAARDETAFTTLRDVALDRQRELADQLGEIIRKHDYRFRNEPTGEERGATGRAAGYFTGGAGLEFRGHPQHKGQSAGHW